MNQLYTPARQKFLTGQINWDASDVRIVLLSAAYEFDGDHEFLADIAPAARIADTDVPTESSSAGFALGGQAQFLSLISAEPVVSAALYINTGVEATSGLLAFYDVIDGFPFTPTGLDYYLSQDIVFGGFFRL